MQKKKTAFKRLVVIAEVKIYFANIHMKRCLLEIKTPECTGNWSYGW